MSHPRRFRFGVQASGPTDAAGWISLARRAEELGYSTLSMADHFDDDLAVVPTLATVAAATTELRIGSLVFANDFRHPALLAKEAATLDVLSGGRLELGVGAGWQTTDYEHTGIPLDPAGVRIDRLGEAIEVVNSLFGPDPVTYDGAHYRIEGLVGRPSPVQSPRPPVLVGGGGRRILTLAGRLADIVGVNPNLAAGVIDDRAGPSATADATRCKLAWVREGAGDRFDDLELQTRVHIAAITDDRDGLARTLAPVLGIDATEALASPHAVAGTVEECIDHLRRVRDDHGISYITWGSDSLESMAPIVEALAGS
ncbi:MAG: TIGR03621 family F420-dependent LLM class oxidoreductase [Acidimicrobiales bacterium]|nr:TIGR03621 family F420-dependent LLM class oxidoreductase [Acidimicrobiales bacterium]